MKPLRLSLLTLGASALLFGGSVRAIDMALSPTEIEHALQVSRSDAVVRAAFHRSYVVDVPSPAISRLEVITELRRLVLLGEEHVAAGDVLFTRGTREATEALAPWRGKVTVAVSVRFDPRNGYVLAPPIDVTLHTRSGAVTRLAQRSRSVFGHGTPGAHYPVLGADAEAEFAAAPLARADATLVIGVNGKETYRGSVDFKNLD